jgi:Tfp pilus assembly protein PilE
MTTNKKGLFLAEILLAVVIAAVIMGSGYLLYADIQKENQKNEFAKNLSALTIQLNQFYGEQPVIFTGRPGRTYDNSALIRSKTIPSTMQTDPTNNLLNTFGHKVYIGPASSGTSLYFIKSYLDTDQCSSVLQHVLQTKPIAFASSSSWTGQLKLYQCITDSDTKRTMVKKVCTESASKTTSDALIPIYSPKGEEWNGCKSRF